jgi:hypothetical protein
MRSHLNPSNPHLGEAQAELRARVEQAGTNRIDPEMRPYAVEDLMVLHNLSRQTIIRIYENEPEIEVVPDLRPPGLKRCTTRRRRTIKVPRHVYLRVRNRMRGK